MLRFWGPHSGDGEDVGPLQYDVVKVKQSL